jgi:hypothetical protein
MDNKESELKYNLFDEWISDEEFKIRLAFFNKTYNALYDNMDKLTHLEYKEKSKDMYKLLDFGQHIIIPNTLSMEQREFDLFGVWWYEYKFKGE